MKAKQNDQRDNRFNHVIILRPGESVTVMAMRRPFLEKKAVVRRRKVR